MISYKKRAISTEVDIELKGSYTEEQIVAVLSNTANYISDISGPVVYRIDCREMVSEFNSLAKKRIVQFTEDQLRGHYVRIVLIYAEQRREQVSEGLLHRVNNYEQLKMSIAYSVDDADSWLDEEVEKYMMYLRLSKELEERRAAEEVAKAAELARAEEKKQALEMIQHDDIFQSSTSVGNPSLFVAPSAKNIWTPSEEAVQAYRFNRKMVRRDNSVESLSDTYRSEPVKVADSANALVLNESSANYHELFFLQDEGAQIV